MANEMLAAALAYAERGWAIFPCNFDKTPKTKNAVGDATTNVATIRKWWDRWPDANIALNVGEANMMVLDLDPGHNMKELETNVGKLPETSLLARTPRGGQHLYFALADGEIVALSASRLAPHVDVRSFHSYVLLPPSSTKDGAYTWESEGKPAFRSGELLRLANAGREKHKDHDTWIIEADLPENIRAAVGWLQTTAKVAVEGQGGDHCAYATAAMCKSFGVSEGLALELMFNHWNTRCIPPWEAEELGLKVEHAYQYNTSPPGNLTPEYQAAKSKALFEAVEHPSENEWLSPPHRLVNWAGAMAIPSPTWLIEGVLVEGSYAMLYGPSKTYKSFVALDMALSVAAGFALDTAWPTVLQGEVIYVAGEGRSQTPKRMRAWASVHFGGVPVPGFYILDPIPSVLDDPAPFMALLAHCPKLRLVVLDTVGRSMAGADENSQDDAGRFSKLVALIQATGAAVLAIHHCGKDDRKGPRGSTVFYADADTVLSTEDAGDFTVRLTMEKQKDAPEWDRPKLLRLVERPISPTEKSLAVIPYPVEEIAQATEKKAEAQAKEWGDISKLVGTTALAWLDKNKHKPHSNKALVAAVEYGLRGAAKRPAIDKILVALRNDEGQLRRCWRVDCGDWRWVSS